MVLCLHIICPYRAHFLPHITPKPVPFWGGLLLPWHVFFPTKKQHEGHHIKDPRGPCNRQWRSPRRAESLLEVQSQMSRGARDVMNPQTQEEVNKWCIRSPQLPQQSNTEWLITTAVHPVTVLEARSLKSKRWWGHLPSRGSLLLPASGGFRDPLAYGWGHQSLPLSSHGLLFCLTRIVKAGFRAKPEK